MNKIQLLKEPGYIYDLIFIFYVKFNNELCLSLLPDDKKSEYMVSIKDI